MRILWLLLVFPWLSLSQTTVEKRDGVWQIMVNGKPFEVKGVTFGYDDDVANYDAHFEELKSLGVNSVRTWATGPNTRALLDAADRHGIKVMVGIWMRHGRPGMEDDDTFNYLKDTEGMDTMYENAINVVRTYKGHPAVLTWGIGNEVYLNMATDDEKIAYSNLLERICKDIKAMDNSHPISSVEAWTFGMDWWSKYVPSLDIYGLNVYGAGANFLQDELEKRNLDKPYVITEFGVRGEWDITNIKHGVKIEPSDNEKYTTLVNGYANWIQPKASCLGVYMFHYSDSNAFVSPWLLTHVNGFKRPQYWGIRKAFTGQEPENTVPVIKSLQLPEEETESGTRIPVKLEVSDNEEDTLEVSFYYNHREGSRRRRDALNLLSSRGNIDEGFEVELPEVHGGIKVYAYVSDSFGNLGIASDAILVKDVQEARRKYLVPKVDLPFYVYKDGESPYFPSAYMGSYKNMEVDLNHKESQKSDKVSLQLKYTASTGWYGLGLVDPANDWGEILGGYDISGAKTFSFWAKASYDGMMASIGFGLIGKDKPFPDTAKLSREIKLTSKWKRYTLKIKAADLSCIRSGLTIFATAYGSPHDIYLRDVVFE